MEAKYEKTKVLSAQKQEEKRKEELQKRRQMTRKKAELEERRRLEEEARNRKLQEQVSAAKDCKFTHLDFSDWLCRSHITQYYCDYCRTEYHY